MRVNVWVKGEDMINGGLMRRLLDCRKSEDEVSFWGIRLKEGKRWCG